MTTDDQSSQVNPWIAYKEGDPAPSPYYPLWIDARVFDRLDPDTQEALQATYNEFVDEIRETGEEIIEGSPCPCLVEKDDAPPPPPPPE